jgi:hypothetical protein
MTIVQPKRPLSPAGAFVLFITILLDYQKFSKNIRNIFNVAREKKIIAFNFLNTLN